MTRLLLITLVAAALGSAAVPDAEARNKVLRRSSYKASRADEPRARTRVAKAQQAEVRRARARRAKALRAKALRAKAREEARRDKAEATTTRKPLRAASAWSGDRCTQEARAARAGTIPRPAPIERTDQPTEPPGPAVRLDRRWRVSAGAAAGGNAVGMRIARTEGGGGLGTALSAALGVGGAASVRLSGKIRAGVGVDAVLIGHGVAAGMNYRTTEEQVGAVPFQHHQIDARGELAYSGGVELAARAGYHYAQLSIDGESADIPIVGEAIGGYTVGMAAALPMKRVALSAMLDVMPAGVQAPSQVVDGGYYGTAASAAWAGAGMSIRLSGRLLGTAGYRYGRSTIALTDGAATPRTATRVDQSHTILAGIGLAL